jgi:hypothetical protein
MLILHDWLIWALVSLHVLGGAALFSRLFPRESAWFGLVIPFLAVALVCNFVEHQMALTWLHRLLPLTAVGALALIGTLDRERWAALWLPVGVFLVTFAFTFTLHGLRPAIFPVRDGVLDLHVMADFCQGQILPPTGTWLAPLKLERYYAFPHYSASLLIRLMGLDIGTGFNVASALLSAFLYVLVGASAWRLGGGKVWIVVFVVLLTAAVMDGSTPFLWAMHSPFNGPDDATDLLANANGPDAHYAFKSLLPEIDSYYGSHELLPPGYWSWVGSFHSCVAGQFFILFAVYCLVELVRDVRSNWPWIGCLASIPLMVVSSTWGVPFVGSFATAGIAYCVWKRRTPESPLMVAMVVGGVVACLTPMLSSFLLVTTPGPVWTDAVGHTEFWEFIIQWWPIYIPWVVALFYWERLSPAVQIVHVITPLAFLGVEFCTVSLRVDMTGKMWEFVFDAAWVTLLPALAALNSRILRGLMVLFAMAGVLSGCFWVFYFQRSIVVDDEWHLKGTGNLSLDPVKRRIFQAVSLVHDRTIQSGEPQWTFSEHALLGNMTGNNEYNTASVDCDTAFYPQGNGEATRREAGLKDLYAGQCADPVAFLRFRDITALVIWPDDHVTNEALAQLKTKLGPDYGYMDARGQDPAPDHPNAGVFLPAAYNAQMQAIASR